MACDLPLLSDRMPDKFTPWYLFSTVLVAICWSLIHLILNDYSRYSERQFLRFAACNVHEWKGLSVAGPAALFSHRNDNVCLGSHCTFTNWKDAVLRGPLHYSPIETAACWRSHCTILKWKGPCVAGPSALRDHILRGPSALLKTERTVCCGAHGTIHKWKGQCVAGPTALFKTERTCVAGPTALFTNGKDGVLRVPSAQGHMDRPQLDLLEDGNGLLMSKAGHRATVHRENFIT